MRIDVFTIFPDLVEHYCAGSLLGRAREQGLLDVRVHDLRAGAERRPALGGRRPLRRRGRHGARPRARSSPRSRRSARPARCTCSAPGGGASTSAWSRSWPAAGGVGTGGFSLLCGRYEGVDQRVADHLVDGELSIGDYVLAGGEVAALVVIEAVARLVPGVMGNEASAGRRELHLRAARVPPVHPARRSSGAGRCPRCC